MDFSKTNPEIVGENYRLIKEHTGCADPYRETKRYYNWLFLENMTAYETKIRFMDDAVKYAIVANIIDFNPVHTNVEADIERYFSNVDELSLAINDIDCMISDIKEAKSILYLGDNCGEICFDKILIKRIRELNQNCRIYFGVRGEAVVNDNTEADVIIAKGQANYESLSEEKKNIYFLLMTKCNVIADDIGVREKH